LEKRGGGHILLLWVIIFWTMTDTEFFKELKRYLADLVIVDKPVIRTEFYCELQPGLVSFGGHFILPEDQTIPVNIKKKSKSSNADFADKVTSFHRQSTNGGLNKWNKALFKIDKLGEVEGELIWDEVLEQEEINSHEGQSDSVRQKWYWEEK
jgi:hypothetical protein